MYTSTSVIIQACNNSNSNYKHFCISNLLQPSESLFKFFYLFSFKHFIPSSIQIYTRKRWYILHKILDKIRKTNFIIDQFKEKNLLTTPITCIVIGIRRLTINLAFASVVDSMHIAWASIFHHFSSLPSFFLFLLLFITVFHTRIDYIYIYNHALETSNQTPFENETCNDGTMTFRNTFCTSTYRDSSLKFACSMNNFARKSFLLMKQERGRRNSDKNFEEKLLLESEAFYLKFHQNLQTPCNVQSVNNR